MKACYLVCDPRMSLAAPTGYGSHIRKTIRAFQEAGLAVRPLVAGDLGDIGAARQAYQRLTGSLPAALRGALKMARDLHEVIDDRRSFGRYRALLEGEGCDFIYERLAPFRGTGRRLARRLAVPLILEVNDPVDETLRFYPAPLQAYARGLERRLVSEAQGVVVGSRRLRDYFADGGLPLSKVRVIYPTADYELFRPPEGRGAGREGPVIGFVGNMRAWHRTDLLLHAFARLGGRSSLELVGEGPELGRLRQLAGQLGVPERVHFLGSIAYERVPQRIAGMDVCVIPNATWYGMPTKLFEYGAMARAVIGPAGTPVEEVICDGVHGRLFPPGDVAALTAALAELCGDAGRRDELGANLRNRLLQEISWPQNVRRILDLLPAACRA